MSTFATRSIYGLPSLNRQIHLSNTSTSQNCWYLTLAPRKLWPPNLTCTHHANDSKTASHVSILSFCTNLQNVPHKSSPICPPQFCVGMEHVPASQSVWQGSSTVVAVMVSQVILHTKTHTGTTNLSLTSHTLTNKAAIAPILT